MASNIFAAIDFDDDFIEGLMQYRDVVLQAAPRTHITRPENWHLTLEFLGPTPRIDEAVAAFDTLCCKPFSLLAGGFGTFGKGARRVLWVGVEPSPSLINCQRMLHAAFRKAGFELQERAYSPHITFSYHWDRKNGVDLDLLRASVLPLTTEITSAVLLRSVQEGGMNQYEELARKSLA